MIITQGRSLLESTNLEDIVLEASSIGIEPDFEGAAVVIQESLMDYMNLQEAVFRIDLIEATQGDNAEIMEELYEVQVPKFIDSIMNAVKRFWSWILEMLNKALDNFNRLVLSDAQFIKVYGPKVIAVKDAAARLKEYKGYNWDVEALGSLEAVTAKASAAMPIKGYDDVTGLNAASAKAVMEKVAGTDVKLAPVKAFGVNTVKELKAKFMETLQGSKEPVAIKSVNVKEMIDAISTAKDDIKAIKDAQNQAKKAFGEQMKALNTLKSDYKKAEEGDDKTLRSSLAGAVNAAKDVEASVNNVRAMYLAAKLSALKARRSEYKKVITAIAGGADPAPKQPVKESLDSLIWR